MAISACVNVRVVRRDGDLARLPEKLAGRSTAVSFVREVPRVPSSVGPPPERLHHDPSVLESANSDHLVFVTGDGQRVEVPARDVASLEAKNRGRGAATGLGIGLLAGALTGTVLLLADPPECSGGFGSFCLNRRDLPTVALLSGLLGGLVGSLVGAAVGATDRFEVTE